MFNAAYEFYYNPNNYVDENAPPTASPTSASVPTQDPTWRICPVDPESEQNCDEMVAASATCSSESQSQAGEECSEWNTQLGRWELNQQMCSPGLCEERHTCATLI